MVCFAVLIGFNLVNITDVNEKEETIDFEGAIYLEWVDPRLAYDPRRLWNAGRLAARRLFTGSQADLPGALRLRRIV